MKISFTSANGDSYHSYWTDRSGTIKTKTPVAGSGSAVTALSPQKSTITSTVRRFALGSIGFVVTKNSNVQLPVPGLVSPVTFPVVSAAARATETIGADTTLGRAQAHDMSRFVTQHRIYFKKARGELVKGKKTSHWMWYIFPQITGLGSSDMSKAYAIKSVEEAQAYLQQTELVKNLRDSAGVVLGHLQKGARLNQIFAPPDDRKFKSSITLFARASAGQTGDFKVLHDILALIGTDQRTLAILAQQKSVRANAVASNNINALTVSVQPGNTTKQLVDSEPVQTWSYLGWIASSVSSYVWQESADASGSDHSGAVQPDKKNALAGIQSLATGNADNTAPPAPTYLESLVRYANSWSSYLWPEDQS
jgi:uncharacterized protein (DUF1810 family)